MSKVYNIGCKDIRIRKSEFVKKTQFLSIDKWKKLLSYPKPNYVKYVLFGTQDKKVHEIKKT